MIVGGRSPEHAISLASGDFVRQSLRAAGYQVQTVGITKSGEWRLLSDDVKLEFSGGTGCVTNPKLSRGAC